MCILETKAPNGDWSKQVEIRSKSRRKAMAQVRDRFPHLIGDGKVWRVRVVEV